MPVLHKLRSQVLPLDTVQQVTRGNPFRARAFLDYLDPARGVYTALAEEEDNIRLVGQVTHLSGTRSSHLSCIAPVRGVNTDDFPSLLDHLIHQASEWDTYHLLAETDELSTAFEPLRDTGFSVYAWQRIWRCDPINAIHQDGHASSQWYPATDRDQFAIRSLHQALVPALVQPVEDLFDKKITGLQFRYENNLIGFADIINGREGTWVQPYIHPEAGDVPDMLSGLLKQVGRKFNSPVFICVRSYQAWIESALADLPVLASPRQALMVKHLAIPSKVSNPVSVPTFEKNPTTSAAHTEQRW